MDILFLADSPETIPRLAEWFRTEWPDEVGDDVETRFRSCTNRDEIPIGLVAVENGVPIGTVQLLSTSVHSHPHLKPWIGGLYVVSEQRHRKVASRLINTALGVAKSIEFETVYIGIQRAREFYEADGWVYEGDGKAGSETVMILSRRVR